MIRYLPSIYKDELFSSWLCRWYAHSPYTTSAKFTETIFRRANEPIDYLFFNSLSDETYKIIDEKIGISNLIREHTLVPFYSAFSLSDEKNRVMERAIRLDPGISHYLSYPTVHCSYVRYCPMCIQENSEIFFTRQANIIGIDYCPIHRCRYNKTDIKTDKERFSTFKSADQIHLDLSVKELLREDDINIIVAKYVADFIQAKQNYSNDIPIGAFLGSRLEGTPYMSPRGGQKNLDILMSDLEECYHGFTGWTLTKPRLATILRDRFINIIDILLIAHFLKITANELQHPVLPKASQLERFDATVRELYGQGYTVAKIARTLSVNREVIRKVLLGEYDR